MSRVSIIPIHRIAATGRSGGWRGLVVGGVALLMIATAGRAEDAAVSDSINNWDYQIGDVAEADIFVPAGLRSIDRSLGLGLSAESRPEQLWVYRRELETTARVVASLQADFVEAQRRFRAVLIETFGQIPVSRRDVNSVRFRSLQATFQNANDGFPVSYQLAVAWAYELDDSHFFLPVSLSVYECFIGRAVLPEEEILPDYADEVLVLPVNQSVPEGPVEETMEGAVAISGISVDAIPVVQDRVYRALAGESLILADYVSRRVVPNAIVDEDLTRRLRSRKAVIDSLSQQLTPGALVVGRGETITQSHLDRLAALQKVMLPPEIDLRGKPKLSFRFLQPSTWLHGEWSVADRWNLGLGFFLILAASAWVIILQRRPRSRLPAVIPDGRNGGFGTEEERAEESVIVRALRDRTVQALYSQHKDFLEHERSATELLREFEERVASLEPRTQAKIRSYEAKIEELERQLADKEEENRELIRIQIQNTRKEMARAMSGSDWEAN
ncbi:MAG: hypothetical protein R3F07_08730 [Opitutaceae bacterium]